MKLLVLLLVVGIFSYCSEKNVFKKLKQMGGEVTVEGTNRVPIIIGAFAIILGGIIAVYFAYFDENEKWKCDATSKTCTEDPKGTHDTKDKCDTACAAAAATKKWKCDSTSNTCKRDDEDGTYLSDDACKKKCAKTQ